MPLKEYERHRQRVAERRKQITAAGQDIGTIPAIKHPRRRTRTRKSFLAFCDVYFSEAFHLDWSPDHMRVIDKIEEAVLHGGLFAMAMPRGSGKTTLAEVACLWALVTGAQGFVFLIGSDLSSAVSMLQTLKTELECNDGLLDDYPRATYPIRALEGSARRCEGQRYKGKRTHIKWTATEMILATIPRAKCSGGIVRVAGLTGGIRGAKYTRPDGRVVRPSLVILDDPQTDESARSPAQNATREAIVAGAVLGLAGPGRKIAGVMPCTVIYPGDMADNILDTQKHPEWNGERTRMVYTFPTNQSLWDQYEGVRADGFRAGGGLKAATDFYRANRAAMDAGAKVAWDARYNSDELSAIQHAMNLKFRDERAFFAEYQNEPMLDDLGDAMLTAAEIAKKTNGLKRRRVPEGRDLITLYIDVQQRLLYYVVTAWSDNFTGDVIDYGTYPDQKREYFTAQQAKITLAMKAPGTGLEGSIYAGLEVLVDDLLGREWHREDGAALRIDRCLIDANWGKSTTVIYKFCRQSRWANLLLPGHGRYVGASSIPFCDYKKQRGDRVGFNWRQPATRKTRAIRHVIYDTNHWKSFIHSRLGVAMGDPGCLALWEGKHRAFSEHMTSEYSIKTEGRGRTVDEWKERPERPQNHWFDCLVGCAVAASIQGATLLESVERARKAPKKPIWFADVRRAKQDAR